MMSDDDNEGQMIFGDLGGLKLPDIRLTGEEKPRKTSPRKLIPTRDRTRSAGLQGRDSTDHATILRRLYFLTRSNVCMYKVDGRSSVYE